MHFYFGKNACFFEHTILLCSRSLGRTRRAMRFSVRGFGYALFYWEKWKWNFINLFTTTNELLKLCKDETMRVLLERQQKAVAKAWEDYHAIMKEKEQK